MCSLPTQRKDRILLFVTVALGTTGAIYLLLGINALLWGEPRDLLWRWYEMYYVRQGINPYDVTPGSPLINPAIGYTPIPGGYAPWAFLMQELFVPPISFSAVRWHFALATAIAFGVIGLWAYRTGSEFGRLEGWFFVAICAAMAANYTSLKWGNYPPIITALLIAMVYFANRNRPIAAGSCLALAMLKPQMAALFIFFLLAKKQWKSAAVAIALTLVACYLGAWRVNESPQRILQQMFDGVSTWTMLNLGILQPLHLLGVSPTLISKLGMVLGLAATALLAYRFRNRSDFTLLAIICVTSLLWTYHRRYDHIMAIFLLIPLARLALASNSRWHWGLLIVNGLFLWLPLREAYYGNTVTMFSHFAALIAGLIAVLLAADPNPARYNTS